jgi:hypothetical protein
MNLRHRSLSGILLVLSPVLLLGCLPPPAIGGAETRHEETLQTRPNATVRLEVLEPKDMEPKGMVLLLPGGGGDINPHNLVVRAAPQIARLGYIAVVMDSPSDRRSMDFKYRLSSEEHHADMKKAIDYVHGRYPQKSLFLLAFSAGNTSAAILASRSGDLKLSGIVFMGGAWQLFDDHNMLDRFARIPYPVLLVHHENDACGQCLFAGARKYYGLLETKGRNDFLALQGGSLATRIGDACGPYHHHAFEGLESKVVRAVVDWMEGKGAPKLIE